MFKKLLFAAVAAVCCSLVAEAAEPITYLDWDPETRQLEERTVTEYTVIDENWTPTELNGWYVVDGEEVDKGGLSVNGEAHIILKDGSSLYLHTAGLHVGASGSTTNAVTIYGQQEGTGVLSAWGASGCAAIGGQSYEDCGRVTINGGRVIAERGSSASGIGGGREGDGGTVTINGGTLDVPQSSSYSLGAGIGGGRNGGAGGVVTINGGCVSVYGGSKAAGIGGGSSGGAGATVTVNGGRVMAYGGANAAGIGGGDGGVGGAFVMNGGWVRSKGAGTAGIGSGASVTGLHGDFMVLSSDIAVAAAGSSPLMT
ncbi:MAG: hypothetical protein KBT68_05130, partial [bacterium]|nr:hypothetical protein [Candidatus Colisoma equi]